MEHARTEVTGNRLAIEFGTELHIDHPRIRGRYKVHLVGMVPNRFLIVTPPSVVYEDGDPVVLRYVFQGNVFGFRSAVHGTATHPLKLLVLHYPTQVEAHNIRNAPRIDCFIPCALTPPAPDPGEEHGEDGAGPDGFADDEPTDAFTPPERAEGILNDLSRTGCRVLIRTDGADRLDLTDEAPIVLSFRLRAEEEPFTLHGVVKRLTRDSQRTQVGIAFTHPADDAYDGILEFLGPAL